MAPVKAKTAPVAKPTPENKVEEGREIIMENAHFDVDDRDHAGILSVASEPGVRPAIPVVLSVLARLHAPVKAKNRAGCQTDS